MQIEQLEVGQEYKVNAPNSAGVYKILEITENSKGNYEIKCRSQQESFPRIFRAEQFVEAPVKTSKSVRQLIVSAGSEPVFTHNGFTLYKEAVTHWPSFKRRGRPGKGA